jgi:hypothetical protein
VRPWFDIAIVISQIKGSVWYWPPRQWGQSTRMPRRLCYMSGELLRTLLAAYVDIIFKISTCFPAVDRFMNGAVHVRERRSPAVKNTCWYKSYLAAKYSLTIHVCMNTHVLV